MGLDNDFIDTITSGVADDIFDESQSGEVDPRRLQILAILIVAHRLKEIREELHGSSR